MDFYKWIEIQGTGVEAPWALKVFSGKVSLMKSNLWKVMLELQTWQKQQMSKKMSENLDSSQLGDRTYHRISPMFAPLKLWSCSLYLSSSYMGVGGRGQGATQSQWEILGLGMGPAEGCEPTTRCIRWRNALWPSSSPGSKQLLEIHKSMASYSRIEAAMGFSICALGHVC